MSAGPTPPPPVAGARPPQPALPRLIPATAGWIALGGAVVITLWILGSPTLLEALGPDAASRARWRPAAGLLFAAAFGALLWIVLRRSFGVQRRAYASLLLAHGELERLKRMHAALGQINQAIVWSATREALFTTVCRVLVEHGGFRMAWIGWHDPERGELVPVASHGDTRGYASSIRVRTDDSPEGRGPHGTAFRERRTYICNDFMADPATAPWREKAAPHGIRASAALPIRLRDVVQGVLNVYAAERGCFRSQEIALLEEAATDISFALDNLARAEEHRRAETAAHDERRFSDAMIESMPGILYFYDMAGRFLRWNRNFEVVSGYTAEEIARMQPLEFFVAEDRSAVQARIAEVFETGESSVEAPFLARDGTRTSYYFTGRRVVFGDRTCLVGIGIDVSQRKQAEAALRLSERNYRELVEHANSIILRWGSDGRIILLNEFGQRFFGYTAAEIVGRSVIGTIVPETESSGRDLQRLMADITSDPSAFQRNTNENMRRDGSRVWISWTNRIVHDEHGRVREILSIGADITEQLRAERAVRELNATLELRVAERTEQLRSALVQAESADRIKSAFLATMSHELRTPLNSIIGFTGIVLQGLAGPLNAEQEKQLGMVRTSARHLLELINDVLDISRIEAGRLEVRREPFALDAAIERAVATVHPLADRKGLSLEVSTIGPGATVLGDRRRLEQILINLLSNAVKFTEHGGVALAATPLAEHRLDDGTPTGPAVRITVSDTGIGIAPEDLPTLFQPFRQIDTGLQRQHEGTGLGLAICRRLASLMGGEISATSDRGRGSAFTLILPLGHGPDDP